ncbi:MAG: thymidine kinase [Patescibacteria group bacterium]|nr:thymidine kinase [Patescibacteria group bacterium]
MYSKPNSGWIEVICGCMFCGKTEELIRRVRRAEIAKETVQVFKPHIDSRYSENEVASHNGLQWQATAVCSVRELKEFIDEQASVVAIDEVQFFDNEAALISLCEELADRGVRVVVAGLDLDFRGEPFGAMPELLARAEEVTKLHAICVKCGESATRTQRIIDGKPAAYDDPIILVGGQKEGYEARCRSCHQVCKT